MILRRKSFVVLFVVLFLLGVLLYLLLESRHRTDVINKALENVSSTPNR